MAADKIVQTPKGPRRITDKVRAAARENAKKARAAFLAKHKAGTLKRKAPERRGIQENWAPDTMEIPLDSVPAPVAKKKYAKRAAAPATTNQSYAEFVAAAWLALERAK